jgi:hypothetical protein
MSGTQDVKTQRDRLGLLIPFIIPPSPKLAVVGTKALRIFTFQAALRGPITGIVGVFAPRSSKLMTAEEKTA